MSFWEDRFVNRPHAGAAPPSQYDDYSYTHVQASAYPQLPSPDDEPSWVVEPAHADEIGDPAELTDVEPLDVAGEPDVASEDETEPAHEYRRKGLFRRRRPVLVEARAEDEIEAETDEAPEPETNENEPYASEANETETWNVVSEPEPELDDLTDSFGEPAEEAPAEKKRGLFRRRKPVEVESAVETDDELGDSPEVEIEPESENDVEPAHDYWQTPADEDEQDEQEDELAVSAESLDVPVEEKPRRRGLFRRRKSAPVDDSVSDDFDTTSVEDDSFANVSYWGSEVTSDAQDPVEDHSSEDQPFDEPAHDPDPQLEEPAPAFVYGEDESAADEGTAEVEPADDSSHGSEPEHEVVAERSDSEPAVDSTTVEREPVSGPVSEPSEAEVYASEGEQALEPAEPEVYALDEEMPVSHEVEAFEPQSYEPQSYEPQSFETETLGEHDPADEPMDEEHAAEEPVSVVDDDHELEAELDPELDAGLPEWQSHDDSPDEDSADVEASQDVVLAPVPMKKRNGTGSRGKKVVGLKVGASQLAAAVVSGSGERPALVDVARRSLEEGVVVGGELRDPDALVHALRTFFKESRLPTKNVRLGLSSSRVGVRTFEIAGVEDEARFDNAVRFKAHEVLPVAAHESVLDYRVIEEKYTESGEVSRRVLLVVAPRDQVEPYIEACRSAGLRLAGVDLESFGLLRTFVPPFGSRSRTEDSATVVVAIGHEASTLLVAGGGICEFTRVFDWGGGALQTAIADELEVPHMEAATILTHLSLSGPGRHLDSLDADMRSRALEAVRARLTPFARELVSSLQFYQTQPDSLGIREILITGGTAHLEGLADALHQMIGVSVSVGDPLGRVDVQTEIPAALEATIGSLAVPIGLAIEDEAGRSVNLVPKESRQTRKRPNALAVAGPLAAALPLAALAFMFVKASGTASDKQAELNAVQAEIAALPEPTRPTIDPALAGEQASRATAVAQILGGRLTWEQVLGDVSRVLPAGVSLTELIATTPPPSAPVPVATTTEGTTDGTTPTAPAPAPVTATTPSGVTVTGYALDYETVARTLARLQAVPSLTQAELQSATPSTLGKKRIIEFTIVAQLATPGGVQ